MAQLAAMIQMENDAVNEAVGHRIDRLEEVQQQTNQRIKKVEDEVTKAGIQALDAHTTATKSHNATQQLAENVKRQENRTSELERRMNEMEKMTKEGATTSSGGPLDDLPRSQRQVVVAAGFPSESRRTDIVEALTHYLQARNIEFAEIYTNFRRTTIGEIRFNNPQAAQAFFQQQSSGGDSAQVDWDGAQLQLRFSLERSPKEAAAAAPILRAAWVLRTKFGVVASGEPQSGRVYGDDDLLLASRQGQTVALSEEGRRRAHTTQAAWEDALQAATTR